MDSERASTCTAERTTGILSAFARHHRSRTRHCSFRQRSFDVRRITTNRFRSHYPPMAKLTSSLLLSPLRVYCCNFAVSPRCSFLPPLPHLVRTMASGGGDGCCPPGSHGAPPPPAFDDQAKGSFVTVGESTPCYYVAPDVADSTKAMVLFPDVWGFKSRILKIADWLSTEAGCHVLIFDPFRGETHDDHEDVQKWLGSVPYEPNVVTDVTACVDYLKSNKGITSFGAMGFCWGVWAAAKTSQAKLVDWKAIVGPHPSLKLEPWLFGASDVELMHSMTCPVLVMPAGNDPDYLLPDSAEFKAMPNPASKSIPFPDMVHGFSTRGDMTDPQMKRDVEACMQASLAFIKEHL